MLGFLVVLLSAICFCVQNVTVRVLFTEQPLWGLFRLGGFVPPTLAHSFLLLFMRMLVVVPLMAVLAGKLYPSTWVEIAQLHQQQQRDLLWRSLGCGLLMFLYLALLYIAIGLIPTGIALTLFFTYPIFTAVFAWGWFGDRPSGLRWGIMALVFLGSCLTMPLFQPNTYGSSWIGAVLGIGSGMVFALYTVLAQTTVSRLHPVPFTWISFATTLVLSLVSLLLGGREEGLPWSWLWIGSAVSAIATFAGHLLNNIGIRLIGAASASIVGATNPALTVVLAWFMIQETLSGVQLGGVAIVTLGVVLLSQEKRLRGKEN